MLKGRAAGTGGVCVLPRKALKLLLQAKFSTDVIVMTVKSLRLCMGFVKDAAHAILKL